MTADIHQILKKYWGFKNFRPLQQDIIESVLEGRDTLALLPTGGGKSVCYQVPALASVGICLVVSPLIALMKDQVEQLKSKGIKAAAVFSGMSAREVDITFDNCIYGDYKMLYLSPERLLTDMAIERIKQMKVSLIAVDEAHCISQWGYDFRPAYLQIATLRELLPKVPVLALTATATEKVAKDIRQKLFFKNEMIFRKSFTRENISYVVLQDEDKYGRLLKVCKNVNGSGIVYVRNRRETQETAGFLNKNGIKSAFYHAGLDHKLRDSVQNNWLQNRTRVIVATNAFGMGIDKPDVRFVVHLEPPDSLEAYYQESGRAGREGKKSYAVLLYMPVDGRKLLDNLTTSFPQPDEIKAVYQSLGNYFQLATGAGTGLSFEFDIGSFCARYNFYPLKVLNALRFLEKDNYISLSENVFLPSRLKILSDKAGLYKFQIANAKFDLPIKTILRSYGGVFDHFTAIDEKLLAKRADIALKTFVELLKSLHQKKIIYYVPKSDRPQLTYLSPRVETNRVNINSVWLKNRREHHHKNITAMLQYAENGNKCRNSMLVEYFGEKSEKDCGLCDYCLSRNAVKDSAMEIRKTMVELLSKQIVGLNQLVENLSGFPEEDVLTVARLLLDENVIRYNEEGLLQVNIA